MYIWEDKEDLCSARNVDVEYKYSQEEDHKHLIEDIDVFCFIIETAL